MVLQWSDTTLLSNAVPTQCGTDSHIHTIETAMAGNEIDSHVIIRIIGLISKW